jgi:hypothetical protein
MQLFVSALALIVAIDVLTGFVEPWHLLIAAFLNGSTQALLIRRSRRSLPQSSSIRR